MILTRETTPAAILRGTVVMSWSTPSTRKRTRTSRPSGARWMSEAPRSTAWATIWLTSLTTGASSEVSCRATTSPSSSSTISPSPDDVFEAVQARYERGDVVRGRDRDAHLVAGHDRDVVDREHVRGVGHRDQQRALVGEGDRHRLVALGDRRVDEVRRRHVHLEDAEVEVVEAVALGERAREPVLGERAVLEQHPLGRSAGRARALERVLDLLARGELHLHDHVGEEARRGAAARGLGDADPRGLAGGGRRSVRGVAASRRREPALARPRPRRRRRARASRSISSSARSTEMTGSAPSGSPSIPKIACRSGPVCWGASLIGRAPPVAGS